MVASKAQITNSLKIISSKIIIVWTAAEPLLIQKMTNHKVYLLISR